MNVNDECPNCKSGTLERNENDLICRGECGAAFPDVLGQAEADEAVKEIIEENKAWARHVFDWPDWLSAVPANIGLAAKVDIGPRGEFSRMVVGLIERAYDMGRKMGQSDMHEMLREAKLALTDGVEDKALVFLLKEIEETILPAPKCAEK